MHGAAVARALIMVWLAGMMPSSYPVASQVIEPRERLLDEVQIYMRILHDPGLGGPRAGNPTFVVLDRTVNPQGEFWWTPPPEYGLKPYDLRKRVAAATPALIDDFLTATRQQRDLNGSFASAQDVTLVSRRQLQEIFDTRDGWARFYSRHPNAPGYLEFSRVAFDPASATALVYVAHYYGNLGGTGQFVLLRRRDTAWRIVNRYNTWES